MVLTMNQAIELLQVSRTTIYRMFDRGELTKIEVGRSVRIELPENLSKKYKEQIKALMT